MKNLIEKIVNDIDFAALGLSLLFVISCGASEFITEYQNQKRAAEKLQLIQLTMKCISSYPQNTPAERLNTLCGKFPE